MAIPVVCECGAKIRAPNYLAGKRGKCPKCNKSLTIPSPTTESSPGPDANASNLAPIPFPPVTYCAPPKKKRSNAAIFAAVSAVVVAGIITLVLAATRNASLNLNAASAVRDISRPVPKDLRWENLATLDSMALPICPRCNREADWKYDYTFSVHGYCGKCGKFVTQEIPQFAEAREVIPECPQCKTPADFRWFEPKTSVTVIARCSNCDHKRTVKNANPEDYSWDEIRFDANDRFENLLNAMERAIEAHKKYLQPRHGTDTFVQYKVGYVCNNCGAAEILDIDKCQVAAVIFPKCKTCQRDDAIFRKLITLFYSDFRPEKVFVEIDFH